MLVFACVSGINDAHGSLPFGCDVGYMIMNGDHLFSSFRHISTLSVNQKFLVH